MSKLPRLLVLALVAVSELALLSGHAAAGESCPKVGFTIVEPHPSAETRTVSVGKNEAIYVRRVPITTTSDIVEIKLVGDYGESDDAASLLIKFTPAADRRLHDATTNHSGRRIAFMFNDEVLTNVVWQGPYGMDPGGVRVSMLHGMARARALVGAIRGCVGATAP